MYTEDDEKVKVKNKNSKSNDSDFYTAFNNQESSKNKKNNKNKKEEKNNNSYDEYNVDDEEASNGEEQYASFYNSNDDNEEVVEDDSNKKGNIIRILIIIFLIIILGVLLWLLLGNKKDIGDIELVNSNITIRPGGKDYISYNRVGTVNNVTSKFSSSNPSVATVSDSGEITAVGVGEATITIEYTIDGKTRKKECLVKVEGDPVKYALTLDLKASDTNWTNKDVTITVNAISEIGLDSVKYAINCNSDNCNYYDVKNNKIVISDNGSTKVTVIAKDKTNQEVKKEVTAKIDKEAPTINYTAGSNISAVGETSVCATCSDSISGCRQSKVCKKYTSSKSNEVITVYDNAGNAKSSISYNVSISKVVPPCTLKVASDGTVTATLNETGTYYGFNSSYSGSNELSKKITINVSKAGEKGAKVVYYYVRTKNGNNGSCYITVIKECKCANNSTGSNCTATCSFRAS